MPTLKSAHRAISVAGKRQGTDPKSGRPSTRERQRAGYLFTSPYAIFLLLFGLVPTGYALWLSLDNDGGIGFQNYINVAQDARLWPAFSNMGIFLVTWMTVQTLAVLAVSLLLDIRSNRATSTARFLYYLPGALAGSAGMLLWVLLLDPTVSPFRSVIQAMGMNNLASVVRPNNLPIVFALVVFFTTAGAWIVILHGALRNLPTEVLEASQLDGCTEWQSAIYVKLPLVRSWVAYMIVINLAVGAQVFVEPQMINMATGGLIGRSWSPNQLAYVYAFEQGDIGQSMVISSVLLIVSMIGALLILRADLFGRE